MFRREMFKSINLSATLRNNGDYITYVLSFISALLFLTNGFVCVGATISGWHISNVLSVFSAVGVYGGGIGVFLVIFIVIDFILLIACALFAAVRFLTEIEVFTDLLEVKFASLPLSPAKIIALTNLLITFVSMIMGGVCAASEGDGFYTPMFLPFIFAALSTSATFLIELFCGKSKRYSVHREATPAEPREEYTEHHGWNGTEESDDDE